MQGGEEKVYTSFMRKRTCKRRKNQTENSEIHLLPAFALPPRGGKNGKKGRGKKERN